MFDYEKIKEQIPSGERIVKTYTAFEGDFRVITENANGHQTRYSVSCDSDGNIKLRKM